MNAEKLLKALKAADETMTDEFDGDAHCDHSVGICWCAYHSVRHMMKEAIKDAES